VGATYTCQSPGRREKVKQSSLNGIDYLEVLDLDAPDGSPRQQTLVVHCFKPLPATLHKSAVTLSGGVRTTGITAAWARRLDALVASFGTPNDPLEPGEDEDFWKNRVAALEKQDPGDIDHWLVVRTSAAGDFSTYTLSLSLGGFDARSASVDFSFKAECPSDFDCPAAPACAPAVPASPAIDYLARDYASFRGLMLDRLAALVPGYAPTTVADLGVTLVEILAHAADQLAYYQDAVATEAYLGTARRRVSVRRHARLLDYQVHEGVNARAWVCFEVGDSKSRDERILAASTEVATIPAGTRLLTATPNAGVVLPASSLDKALESDPVVFETLEPISISPLRNEIQIHTWSDEACCLPAGSTSATLVLGRFEGSELGLAKGDVIVFEEVFGKTGLPEDADPSHRHAVRLSSDPVRTKDEIEGVWVLDVTWSSEDALPFPLDLTRIDDDQRASVARGNVALADHGLSAGGEALPVPPADGRYRPSLEQTGITWRVPYDQDAARAAAAASALTQDVRSATPALQLDQQGTTWTVSADLLEADAWTTAFVAETESDGTVWLRFGDGVHGQRPTAGVALTASYRVGNGAAGNVGADTIVTLVSDTLAGVVLSVTNPLAAAGGVDPETIDEVKRYAPQAFRTQERAVTAADWAEIAGRHPEVQKAVASFRWTGSYTTVFVTVDRRDGLPVDDDFLAEMQDFLEPYRLAGYDLEVAAPVTVPLDIAVSVCALSGAFASDVEVALLAAFSAGTLADGSQGFFHPDRWSFGDPVYLSRVVATAMAVPGVRWVEVTTFQRWGEAAAGEIAAGKIAMGGLEIARLDNDPNAPENGRIAFTVKEGA